MLLGRADALEQTVMKFWIVWVVLSLVVGLVAWKRGRNAPTWFALSMVLSPLLASLLLSITGRDRECPFCKESIKKGATICPHCRSDLLTRQGRVIEGEIIRPDSKAAG
jgi:hypothetical protein